MFVGATALELGDMIAVPVYGKLPGIVVQALATETVNQGAPQADRRAGAQSRCWRCGRCSRRCCYDTSWRRNLGVLALLLVAAAGISTYAFSDHRLLIDVPRPC